MTFSFLFFIVCFVLFFPHYFQVLRAGLQSGIRLQSSSAAASAAAPHSGTLTSQGYSFGQLDKKHKVDALLFL